MNSGFLLVKRVLNRIGRPFGVNPFPRAFPNPLADRSDSAATVFDEIHRVNFWGSKESCSGLGSELAFTASYREGLARCLAAHGIQSLFDAPCGDLNWMSVFLSEHPVAYAGGDISAEVIARARATHSSQNLGVFDVTVDAFPEADAWHCRDCFFHLPFESIRRALRNFAASGIGHALITSHRARILHRNLDVGFGGLRFLYLEWAPFFLPPPVTRIPDYLLGHEFPRYVSLWSRQQIAQAVAGWS